MRSRQNIRSAAHDGQSGSLIAFLTPVGSPLLGPAAAEPLCTSSGRSPRLRLQRINQGEISSAMKDPRIHPRLARLRVAPPLLSPPPFLSLHVTSKGRNLESRPSISLSGLSAKECQTSSSRTLRHQTTRTPRQQPHSKTRMRTWSRASVRKRSR